MTNLSRRILTALVFVCSPAVFGQTPPPPPVAAPTVINLIDGHKRAHWLLVENLGVGGLLENVAIGAVGTATNKPVEYGPHWTGFAKRTGMVTANYGVQSLMEAGFGTIWGEDPRYDRTHGEKFAGRLGHVIKMTFLARNREGNVVPAYARMIAIPGSCFLANEWEPDTQATVSGAALRTALSFASRMGENAFREFVARHY